MANIAGAQECNNEDEEGRSDIESDREDQQPFHNLKKLLHQLLNKYTTLFGMPWNKCTGKCTWSTTVDHIAAVATNAMIQTTLHDYFTS